ncbi:hypothetical protein U1Q18_027339 [Sarracenia purpurea var. burkii]
MVMMAHFGEDDKRWRNDKGSTRAPCLNPTGADEKTTRADEKTTTGDNIDARRRMVVLRDGGVGVETWL